MKKKEEKNLTQSKTERPADAIFYNKNKTTKIFKFKLKL